jgi:hypothetical protein
MIVCYMPLVIIMNNLWAPIFEGFGEEKIFQNSYRY